jgi:hypothetical protein
MSIAKALVENYFWDIIFKGEQHRTSVSNFCATFTPEKNSDKSLYSS